MKNKKMIYIEDEVIDTTLDFINEERKRGIKRTFSELVEKGLKLYIGNERRKSKKGK